ncbi:RNA polymerase sigma-70 factor (ECF subfamily) [Mesonia hippocampi]|uniref:RNA polymerase sigma-70 factor (ECF subfamily) n=1 Tax=Mesonia hippocampi TaxID=1628250 RepID=A0A840EMS4_9FLAO|nr:RNA polymerase sigma factor [Mesonia hippocampi]MBB4119689.1 RNA polymerase sigma-70 factor (ECF subfamily) [Mesonia hippocampi]
MIQHQLIEACRRNDRKAQLKLYEKYSQGMYYVALRFMKNEHDAEEAMQEGFIQAFTKLHQFTGEVTFGAWLKRIVINKSIDMLKARKLDLVALDEHRVAKVEEDNNWDVADSVTINQVKEAIAKLPERYKYPVMLFLIEGYDHEEISEILNITAVSSRTLVHRGKRKLQEHLKAYYNGTGS